MRKANCTTTNGPDGVLNDNPKPKNVSPWDQDAAGCPTSRRCCEKWASHRTDETHAMPQPKKNLEPARTVEGLRKGTALQAAKKMPMLCQF